MFAVYQKQSVGYDGLESWLTVTEIPPKEFGNGKLVALSGCDRTVFRPDTNSVAT
jgi:hypothetical protein